MELKLLKIAGFKSFVDPTVLPFLSQLVAIVGPNGCGKSNIIDAILWVMGEISAKNLRGETMVDVIFNGSTHRKPVGQASVELVFDNSLGRIAGPFGQYAEISVKRVLTRAGESTYYLNGQRCRRKDVVELFLGTGAGARGYSIISQGAVSRLIEAKPEDLKAYIEEAAGVSQYKERRREAVLRMEHTRENMQRVADILDELTKQLQKLKSQSENATQYLALKTQEKRLRTDIIALKWQDLAKEHTHFQTLKGSVEQNLETLRLKSIALEKDKALLQTSLQAKQNEAQILQDKYYQSGVMLTRLEANHQQVMHETQQSLEAQGRLQNDMASAKSQLALKEANSSKMIQETLELQAQLEELQKTFSAKEQALETIENQSVRVESALQALQQQANQFKQEAEIAKLNWEHGEHKRQQSILKFEKLIQQSASFSLDALMLEEETLLEKYSQLLAECKDTESLHLIAVKDASLFSEQLRDVQKQLQSLHDRQLTLTKEHAALLAAQKSIKEPVSSDKYPAKDFLTKPRLMDIIQVEEAWLQVLECVLGEDLKALVLDSCDELWPISAPLLEIGEQVVTFHKHASKTSLKGRLSAHILSDVPRLLINLNSIYTAGSLEEAQEILATLEPHESVITQEGYWLGVGWARFLKKFQENSSSILARQVKIAALSEELEVMSGQIAKLMSLREAKTFELHEQEKLRQSLEVKVREYKTQLQSSENMQKNLKQRITYTQTKMEAYAQEKEELEALILELHETLETLIVTKNEALLSHDATQSELLKLKENIHENKNRLREAKSTLDAARLKTHQTELSLERATYAQSQNMELIKTIKAQILAMEEQAITLLASIHEKRQAESALSVQLTTHLSQHEALLEQLRIQKESFQAIENNLEAGAKALKQLETEIRKLESTHNQTLLDEQALVLRMETLTESLVEQNVEISELLANLDEEATQNLRQEQLFVIMEDIAQLGAINLAAIEEYAAEGARKAELETQYQDLQDALSLLQTAIDTLDKETKACLQSTFDSVNGLFQALFPRLFGGGRAELQWTSGDVLEAGVVVMAQPPGKRNSTIHLLSGGEKAMTAIALVFAIFQLNPSPFCMMDEVDAPLDDINVGRFCKVVEEMSKFVQFIFITHNKLTMELASQLVGVTMREPGVSRLVAVDIEQIMKEINPSLMG